MQRGVPRAVLLAVIGLSYGGFLSMCGFGTAGGGHGCYVIIGLSSAPVGLSDDVIITLALTPILWCVIGFVLGMADRPVGRLAFLFLMVVHYLSLPFVLGRGHFGDWSHAEKVLLGVVAGLVIYFIGQIGLWIVYFVQRPGPKTSA